MTSRVRMRSALFILVAVAGAACGQDPETTANPAAPSLFVAPIARVAGQWIGLSNLVGGNTGGEITGVLGSFAGCLGKDVARRLPGGVSDDVSLTVAQDGATVSAVLNTASGVMCTYKGKASQYALSMELASCTAPSVKLRCDNVIPPNFPPEFPLEALDLAGSSVSGPLTLDTNSGTITGTLTNTYNTEWGSIILKYAYSVNR